MIDLDTSINDDSFTWIFKTRRQSMEVKFTRSYVSFQTPIFEMEETCLKNPKQPLQSLNSLKVFKVHYRSLTVSKNVSYDFIWN